MGLIDFFRAIFFVEDCRTNYSVSPESVLSHYKNELKEVYFDEIIVGTYYEDAIKNIISDIKYYRKFHRIHEIIPLYALLIEYLRKEGHHIDIISWIPQNITAYFFRPKNHTYIICRSLSKLSNIPFVPLLSKKYITKHQAKLSKFDRRKNINNAFFLKESNSELVVGKNILLIDDVVSTGSTFNACAKVLKKWGVKNVYCISLASTSLTRKVL